MRFGHRLQRAIAVIVEPLDQNRSVMVVGEETTGRVLSYRYKAIGEKSFLDDNFLDDIVEMFVKAPTKVEGSRQRKHDFIKNYGIWGPVNF